MPKVSVVSPTAPLRADAVVVGVHRTPGGPALAAGADALDADFGARLLDALRALDAVGRAEELHKIPTLGLAGVPLVVAVGLGDAPAGDAEVPAETARRAAGTAVRALTKRRRVHFALDAPADALAEGALFGAYTFDTYKSQAPKNELRTITIAAPPAARSAVRRAVVVADAVTLVRDLVNTPPNDLYPQTFAARAKELADEAGLEIEVLDERALKRGRYGGILGVGQGSARGPRMVRLTYRPARARQDTPLVALVGKGVTFDTGGLNLKTAGMAAMKSDMGGAAAVLASTIALAALKVPVAVTATVPMVENMPSGTSYRPSDILTMHNGRTVEVTDTDAEGRLILGDAISRAAEDSPARLIEISTLTGAQIVALGARVIGAMGTDSWRDDVVAAGNDVGEASWSMPLPDEIRATLDSPVADLQNLPGERFAGMLTAGRFVGEFVPGDLPWVHLDIAGPSFNTAGPRDYTPKGGTGAGVRTIVAAVEAYAGTLG
ncbi:leucyl aminopeptidase [uncultured Jatrophihabitans sp.]|uniref:leucyl aminopeptidase n=1 Tax=uncultured Jatrophihabitans sp. TaxID=1610747 RepID=UPI0035CC66EC